ncbi:hypothetical protein OH77DRAFT_846925 [Trametes cingulata]|nr:hypothetical protein OH77DRAFT_846925 [Trametes cingulata]
MGEMASGREVESRYVVEEGKRKEGSVQRAPRPTLHSPDSTRQRPLPLCCSTSPPASCTRDRLLDCSFKSTCFRGRRARTICGGGATDVNANTRSPRMYVLSIAALRLSGSWRLRSRLPLRPRRKICSLLGYDSSDRRDGSGLGALLPATPSDGHCGTLGSGGGNERLRKLH